MGSAISIRETAGFLNRISDQLALDGRSEVVLGESLAANQAFQFVAGVAQAVTSQSSVARVDGILLESGDAGDVRPAAMIEGQLYETAVTLPSAADLWLGQDGKLTGTVPTVGAGDVWLKKLARRNDALSFIFSPEFSLKL